MKKIVLLAVGTLVLSGCAGTVNIDPAPDANNPTCAEVIVRLPNTVEGLGKRVTGSQATAAWGDPTRVLLRCGLEPVFSSRLACVTHAGVDWLVDDTEAPSYRFITYGRTPAAEVIMDSKVLSGASVLDALAPSLKYLPSTRNCG
jgi:hypothetical protein